MNIMEDGIIYRHENMGYMIVGRDDTLISKNVVLPQEINGIPVVGICKEAFLASKIETILIPDSVFMIDISAFKNSEELTQVEFYPTDIPKPYLHVWDKAFQNCAKLQTLTNQTQPILCSDYAFQDCLSLIKIQAQFASLYKYVFKNSGVQTVQIANYGILSPNSFSCSKISEIHFAGKVDASKTSLKAIQAKRWVCTKDFNHLDAVYNGVNIHIKD